MLYFFRSKASVNGSKGAEGWRDGVERDGVKRDGVKRNGVKR